jgi:error-prone DNA polymerase
MNSAMSEYVELHCHSNFSFQEGASSTGELLSRAKELDYRALAITNHDNLCDAMEFAKTARSLNIQPIIGCEVTLQGGFHLTLLAKTREGYANLCRLVSAAHIFGDRRAPNLDPRLLKEHAKGLILLTGCSKGEVPDLARQGDLSGARKRLGEYLDQFGLENTFLELQQNLVYGDTKRNRRLVELGKEVGVSIVVTNNVHYHIRERHHLQDCLVAIQHNKSLEESHRERRANSEFFLKSAHEIDSLFGELPDALTNTLRIAERCTFDLSRDLGYSFPDHPVPQGFTADSYLEDLCHQAAIRRYGKITDEVRERLKEEFRLIHKHKLAGFLLLYHEVIQIAREVQVDLGLVDREVPLQETPPGRGRGSSVSMLVGYLIGLSHIDPLRYGLSLERFLPEDTMASTPDIDLDFPRNIREELILRVHQKYGWDRAALTGMLSTYQIKGAIRDLGKALGLPADHVDRLAKRVQHRSAKDLREEIEALPEFRDQQKTPGWRNLVGLAKELDGFPRSLAQHPGGMIISSLPLIDMVPIQPGAIEGRYICQWDKDSIDDAGFVKIDFLALGVLSQMQDTIMAIEQRIGKVVDLSRIDFGDPEVYTMLHQADTIGIFQVESAAQIQTIARIKPQDLTDMAREVAAVRPGVGANNGVRQYIRRRGGEAWKYDHPLEQRALERTLGVILFQDQVNQLAIDVGGLSPSDADQLRRAFAKRKNTMLLRSYWERFREGAYLKGISPKVALHIFRKFNGGYMFPESHAFAFGVTAYQSAWLKRYYPLEFYLGLLNQQPMGFYSPETLKEDARRHGILFLNPNVNLSQEQCIIEGNTIRLGFRYIKNIGAVAAETIVQSRRRESSFQSLADFMERTGLRQEEVESLVDAGALDEFDTNRRALRWEVGIRYRPVNKQLSLRLPIVQDQPQLPSVEMAEEMNREYKVMGLYPRGHIMAHLRPNLPGVLTSQDLGDIYEGQEVTVAGLVIRRQRPMGNAVFITLEDEFGHLPLIVWSSVYVQLRQSLSAPLLRVQGIVSRREGTLNIVVNQVEQLRNFEFGPQSKDWG